MLMPKEDVVDLLCCPSTGRKLLRDGAFLSTGDSADARRYEIVAGFPVLVDFASSVIRKSDVKDLSSVVLRRSYSGFSGALKSVLSPKNMTRKRNVDIIIDKLLSNPGKSRVLIVGGGSMGDGMERIYSDPRLEVVAFDVYASPIVQFLADAHQIPLPDQSFDGVIIQAVLEHVIEPRAVVAEICRVLRPAGLVYSETPFLQHVHEGAYDFTRFTESGHRYLFRDFDELKSGVTAGVGTQLLWSFDYFFRGIFRSRVAGKFVKVFLFWLQYLDRIVPDSYNVDAASGVYFIGTKSTVRIGPHEIVDRYLGAQ